MPVSGRIATTNGRDSMTRMIKVRQVIDGKTPEKFQARPTAFMADHIKWVVPVAAPTPPLPAVYVSAEMTLSDGAKIKIMDSVDTVMDAVNDPGKMAAA